MIIKSVGKFEFEDYMRETRKFSNQAGGILFDYLENYQSEINIDLSDCCNDAHRFNEYTKAELIAEFGWTVAPSKKFKDLLKYLFENTQVLECKKLTVGKGKEKQTIKGKTWIVEDIS